MELPTMAVLLERLVAQWLPPLLLAYWVLAAGSVVVTLLPVPVPQAFKDAVFLSACRGKLWQDKPSALGPLKDWSVPQAWFLHFYVAGCAANAAVLAAYCLSLPRAGNLQLGEAQPLLALLLFQLHLARRALETRCLMRYPRGAVMHGIAYLFGLSYYVVVPLSLLPAGWYRQRAWRRLAPAAELPGRLQQQLGALPGAATPLQALGAAVFFGGMALQFASHWGLASLSKGRSAAGAGGEDEGEGAYQIPTGGAFELVSCPHYLAEIVIYAGLLAACRGQAATLLMLVWVTVNLVLAAGATHRWYRRRFKHYPPRRRALVPFVF